MNLFDLSAKITLDSKGYEQGIDKAKDKTSKLKDSIGNGLKKAGKIGVTAIAGASTAIAGLVTASTKSYADYEQLVGGVDTLFKNSSAKVQEYASNAFKTSGMSANDYMDTVTSFSASMINSLGGDTAKATEYSNRAVTDMSDNANKMGTDMQSIVQTYQSLSRGNYGMLDNLKLGYGGTKAEMERLLADAEKLTGKKFDISNFADVTEAIHAVQTEMGITGTTALEASTTIEGSLNSTKSAWQNLLTGMADSNADVSGLIDNLVESAGNFVKNVTPVILQGFEGIGKLIQDIFPTIVDMIPVIINDFLPQLVESAVSIVQTLAEGLSENASLIGEGVGNLVATLVNGFIEMLPTILTAGIQIIIGIIQGITQAMPELVAQIPVLIDGIINGIIPLLPLLLQSGIDMVVQIAYGLIEALPQLIQQIPLLINGLLNAIIPMYPQLISAGIQIIIQLAFGLIQALPTLVAQVPVLISGLTSAFDQEKENWKQAGKDALNALWDGIKEIWGNITSWFSSKWDGLFNRKASVSMSTSEADGSHAGGLSFVPYDGYIARLHKGERILTAEENKMGAGVNIVQNIYAQKQSASDLMQSAIYQQRKAVRLGV